MSIKTEENNSTIFQTTQNMELMNTIEMLSVRGGRLSYGPRKLSEADIEVPDLTYSGPKTTSESDLEQPDLTQSLSRRRKSCLPTIFCW